MAGFPKGRRIPLVEGGVKAPPENASVQGGRRSPCTQVYSFLYLFFAKLPTAIRPLGEEVLDLAKINAASNAFIDAGRLFPPIDSVVTEMAFFSHAFIGVELHHAERTGFEAGLTTDAGLWINEDDTIRPLMDGVNRTRIFTRGFCALKAARRKIG